MNYKAKLRKKETIANDTVAFHWEKPNGFEFRAGHYVDLTLLNPNLTSKDEKVRAFSLAYAPFEKDVVIATRMSDSTFKQALNDLPIGSDVEFDEPRGDFTLNETETTPTVFIIGGIGITPVRGIIAQATYEKQPHKLTLLYSNKSPADAAFMDDLKSLAEENSNFSFVPVMTDTKPNEWSGESGLIDADMLRKHVSDIHSPFYYLCGPPGMVKDMHEMLHRMEINDDNIIIEEFSGY